MGTIIKRKLADKSIVWKAQVRISRASYKTKTLADKQTAELWILRLEHALKNNPTPLMSKMIQRYEKSLDLTDQGHRQRLRILEWWCKRLEDPLIGMVTPQEIRGVKEILLEKYQPATVNKYQATLSGLLERCVRDWHVLESNPVRSLRMCRVRGFRVRYLQKDEIASLLRACKESYQPALYPYVLIALTTGARKGEIQHIKWKDIDLDSGLIVIPNTKNGEPKALPITPQVREALEAYKSEITHHHTYVWRGRGDTPLHIEKAWRRARKKAGLEGVRFHDLRHTAASYAAMKGVPLRDIQALLGHKTLAMTQRYAHLSSAHLNKVSNTITEGMGI
jgi:integrase